MIQSDPMGSILRPSDYGKRSIKATALIQCGDGLEPHIYDLLYLGLDRISREVCTTVQVEVTAGTVREFVTNYLAENRRRI